jgi:hypothetical protein
MTGTGQARAASHGSSYQSSVERSVRLSTCSTLARSSLVPQSSLTEVLVLNRDDLLQSGGSARIVAGNAPPAIAILRGPTGSDTLLRVAVYPAEQIAYCGLWYDGDLLLGGSIVPTMMLTAKLFLAGRIEVLGRLNLQVRLVASWDLAPSVAVSSAVDADAEIVDGRGNMCERLQVANPTQHSRSEPSATILQFPATGSRARHPSSRPKRYNYPDPSRSPA